MFKKTLKFGSALALILGLSLLSFGTFARADDNQGNNYQGDSQNNQGDQYRFHDGQWHGQGDVVVSDLPVGSVVEDLPPKYTTLVAGNTSYYYDNTRYYSRLPDGTYIVVKAP
jgi:hypothetical protein